MDVSKIPFMRALFSTISITKKNISSFLPLILSDLAFIMIFGNIIWKKSAEKLYVLLGDMLVLLNQNQHNTTLEALIAGSHMLRSIQVSVELKELTGAIYKELLILIFWVLVIWIIFQGFNYFIIKKMAKEKFNKKLFVQQFIVDNIMFFALITIIIAFFGKMSTIIRLPFWQQSFIVIGLLLLIFAIHTTLTSYAAMGNHKKIFSASFRRAFNWNYILMWIIIGLLFFIIELIMRLFSFHIIALIVAGVLLVIPAFNCSKLYILETTKAVNVKKK